MCNIRFHLLFLFPTINLQDRQSHSLPAVHYVHRCAHTDVSAHKGRTEPKSVVITKYSG